MAKANKSSAAIRMPVTALKGSAAAIKKANSRLGAFALSLFLAKASVYCRKPYRSLEKLVAKGFATTTLTAGNSMSLDQGMHILQLQRVGGGFSAFDRVDFKNAGKDKAVLIIETSDRSRVSQGVSYVQLEPGATFSFRRNHPAVIIAVLAVGSFVLVFVVLPEVGDAIQDALGTCGIAFHDVLPDSCCGQCPNGRPCVGTHFVPYGPTSWGWTQPDICGCP